MSSNQHSEPSMDEILASIRKIISDDDTKKERSIGASGIENSIDVEPEKKVEEKIDVGASASDANSENIATQSINFETILNRTAPPQSGSETVEDKDIPVTNISVDSENETQKIEPVVSKNTENPTRKPDLKQSIASLTNAASASQTGIAGALGRLSSTVNDRKQGSLTLEELTTTLLTPMISEWLDKHLEKIVEVKVEKELERIIRQNGI